MVRKNKLKSYLQKEIRNVDEENKRRENKALELMNKEKELFNTLGLPSNQNSEELVDIWFTYFLDSLYKPILTLIAYHIFELQDSTFQVRLQEGVSIENVMLLEKINEFLTSYNLGSIQTREVVNYQEYTTKGYLAGNIEIRFRTTLENLIEAYDMEISKITSNFVDNRYKKYIRNKRK